MKRSGGLAIALLDAKKSAEASKDDDYEGDEVDSGTEAAAKELFAAIKDDDEETFVKAFKNACSLMRDE